MKIRIGHLSTFYHTAILLMASPETPARLGAEIEWRLMGTGPAIMQAFKKRELDIAYVGLPPAIIGIDQGIRVVCVAGGHMEGTVLASKSAWKGFPELQDLGAVLKQFSGRRIGVPGRGSIHDVILKDRIEHYGLASQINVVNYPWADLVTEAIVSDQVSAAIGTPALAAAIRRFAGGKVLYPPSGLWPDNPSYGIVVEKSFLSDERVFIEQFLRLHEEAAEYMRLHPQDAAQKIADYIAIVDREFVLDTLNISPKYCAKLSDAFIASTLKFVPALRKLGYIKSNITEQQIFSRELIDTVHPGKEHY